MAGGQVVAWDQGYLMFLHRVSLDDLRPGSSVVLEEAEYFGAKLMIAGVILKTEAEMEEKYVMIRATGTDSRPQWPGAASSLAGSFPPNLSPQMEVEACAGSDRVLIAKAIRLRTALQ